MFASGWLRGWRVPLIMAAAAVLFVGSTGVALHRAQDLLLLQGRVQRVSVWFTTQALVELHRFRAALMRFDRGDLSVDAGMLGERFEVMLSRLDLLGAHDPHAARSLQDWGGPSAALRQALEEQEPLLLAFQPGDTAAHAQIEDLLAEAERHLTQLNLALHHEREEALAAAAESERRFGTLLLLCVGGLLVSAGLMITLLRRGMQRATEAERTLRGLVDALPLGVAAFDTEGRCVLMNEVGLRWGGFQTEADVLGRSDDLGLGPALHADIVRAVATREALPPCEAVLRRPDGGERMLLVSVAPVFGERGEVMRVVQVGLDVTDRHAAAARIRHLAEHDALTGLPNRLLFAERLRSAVADAKPHSGVAVHCLDLDHFKEVNDSLGHPVGDQLLLAAASRMRTALREEDMLARLGGDEFAVIQPGVRTVEEAAGVALRLTEVLSAPFRIQGYTLHARCSVGTALAPQHGTTTEALLQRADIALYRAKAAGRGQAAMFSAEMEAGLIERRHLEEDLRRAIAARELTLVFQPKFSMGTGRVTGCEALVRWPHRERGWVPPALFIPVAEESGLVHALTRVVLETACRQAMAWRAEGLEVPVAVNLSAVHFGADQGVQLVEEALSATGADPRLLEVEVTEGVFLRNSDAAARSFTALRRLGVRVALDDFGTGYSSLGYVQRLRFDVIKIDRQFIHGLEEAGPSRQIVDAIVRLAHGLHAKVVAEGVETEAQLSVLRELGCDEGQGYLLGRPVPAAVLAALVRERVSRARAA